MQEVQIRPSGCNPPLSKQLRIYLLPIIGINVEIKGTNNIDEILIAWASEAVLDGDEAQRLGLSAEDAGRINNLLADGVITPEEKEVLKKMGISIDRPLMPLALKPIFF